MASQQNKTQKWRFHLIGADRLPQKQHNRAAASRDKIEEEEEEEDQEECSEDEEEEEEEEEEDEGAETGLDCEQDGEELVGEFATLFPPGLFRAHNDRPVWLPIDRAAQAVGVGKSFLSTWASRQMICSVKAPGKNRHRLVSIPDITRFMLERLNPRHRKRFMCGAYIHSPSANQGQIQTNAPVGVSEPHNKDNMNVTNPSAS
jgi:hypothetical protein